LSKGKRMYRVKATRPERSYQGFLLLLFLAFLFCLLGQAPISAEEVPAQEEAILPEDSLPPAPPSSVVAEDTPNDAGGSITITWAKSPDDGAGRNSVVAYEILRSTAVDGEYEFIGNTTAGAQQFMDTDTRDKVEYFYKIKAVTQTLTSASVPSQAAISTQEWFNTDRVNTLIAVLVISLAIFYFIRRAKAGKNLYIRKIAGLEALDDAVGRATEMGKKVFYVPGIMDMNSMMTIAGITILGKVAQLTAGYEAKLEVPTSRSMVMVSCRETVKEAYTNVGRPDAYNDNMIYYLTDDQFGFAAAVDGLFVREKPAAIFLQGHFFAESLILAETGNSIGAIQIAGTAAVAQLPFFVAACDYTLIGEEFFAASAYLSNDPRLLGSIKGQDVGKFLFLLAILVGVVLATAGVFDLSVFFITR
jgi:hypothetical protein